MTDTGELEIKYKSKGAEDRLIQPWEEVWVKSYPYLLERGYRLPDRYHPEWVPSWHGSKKKPFDCPDFKAMWPMWKVLDATRLADGKRVVLKMVDPDRGIAIHDYLNSPELQADPRNHTVPILDKIEVPGPDNMIWIVMPLLMPFDELWHPYQYVSEIVETVLQLLEGLAFMHEHGIAHKDACLLNIMVDPTKLVPDGDFSFSQRGMSADCTRFLKHVTRRSVGPLKYFFIDFETAIQYHPNDTHRRCHSPVRQQEYNVPELMEDSLDFDPFKLDIFQLGRIFPPLFEQYEDLEFLEPLHQAMTCPNPDDRPTAAEALAMFKDMISSFSEEDMARRFWGRDLFSQMRREKELRKSQGIWRRTFARLLRIRIRITAKVT